MNNLILRVKYDGVTYDLDAPSDISFRVDLSAVENGSIGDVFGVASQQFDLPSSTTNDLFFKAAYNINAAVVVGFKNSVECQVLQGGNAVYKGNLILDEVVSDGERDNVYKVTIVNEVIDFQTDIQDQYIRDLDFSDYDHIYSMANITSSFETSSFFSGDVFYPLVDYGTDKTDNTIPVVELGGQVGKMDNSSTPLKPIQFKPAIRTKTIIDKIFDSVGYEYSSSFFNSADFQNTYVLTTPSDRLGIETQGYQDSGFFVNITSSQDIAASPALVKQFYPQEQYDPAGGYSPATGTYTIQTDGQYAFRIIGNVSAPDGTGTPTRKEYNIQIRINGSTQFAQFYDLIGSTYGQVTFVTPGLTLTAGDTVEVYHRYTMLSTVAPVPDLTLTSQAFSTIYAPTTVVGGNVNLSQQFDQQVKSIDFLKGVIEMFNLVVEPKQGERKTLIIEPFDTWRDSGEVKDWTLKFDEATKISIKHPIQDQPRELKYSLESDEDPLNQYSLTNFRRDETYGTHTYTADTDVAQGERKIGSFFAATPTKGVAGGGNLIIPQLYKAGDGEKSTFQFKPRLLYRLNERPANDANGGKIYVKDDDGNSVGLTEYSTLSILNSLPATTNTLGLHYNTNTWYPFHQNYQEGKTINGLFNEYWGRYINELYDDDARMLTCNIYFEPFELSQIKLNDKIFIKDAYYRINKISGFNVSKRASVQVELLKASVSKFKFKRHRVTNDLGVDVIVTATDFNTYGGQITYTDIDTGTTYTTGSFLGNIARRDGFVGVSNQGLWKDNANLTLQTEGKNTVDGSNDFDPSVGFAVGSVTSGSFKKDVDRVFAIGSKLTIGQEAKSTLNVGDNNLIEDRAEYTTLLNTTNAIVYEDAQFATIIGGNTNKVSGSNATIIASNNTSMNNAQDAVILAGDDTQILNSNKSVAIGQDLSVSGGNSNIVIGNFDTTTKTVTDMINTVVINPNRDIESRENLGGDDFSGRAYMGSHQTIGAVFADNTPIEVYKDAIIHLTGSEYAHDHIYHLSWNNVSGSNGVGNVYLPEADPANVTGKEAQGYKRMIRFICDNSVSSNDKIRINAQSTDTLDGATGGWFDMTRAFEGLMVYAPISGSWYIIQQKA